MKRRKSVTAVLEEIERRIDNSDLLSPEEKEAAREKAREHVAKARKEKAVDAYFKAAIKEEEREYEPTEQLEDFTVDLPEYTYLIKIDNIGFYQGVTYEVPYSQARSMADLQARAWDHDREIHGQRRQGDISRDPFNKGVQVQRNVSMSMATGAVSTTHNMRMPRI